jgi:F-type H+-transporting ATPase subunit gamma
MPSTRDIRRRIKSVKNTAQITKAMQMVAASKMRKAQAAAQAGEPYAQLLHKMLVSLRERTDPEKHPLLERREGGRELVILLSTDKGLCGGLNTNLFREAVQIDGANTDFVVSGRKGVQFLSRMQRTVLADFALPDSPNFLQSKAMSKFCLEKFLDGSVNRVSVLYPRFVSTLMQVPTRANILPIAPQDAIGNESKAEEATGGAATEYLFEPNADQVLDNLLPYYVHFQIYQMLLNARASEQSARMVAMKNATDNAKSLVKDLTLEYNKVRQASITSELLEISTAQMALE